MTGIATNCIRNIICNSTIIDMATGRIFALYLTNLTKTIFVCCLSKKFLTQVKYDNRVTALCLQDNNCVTRTQISWIPARTPSFYTSIQKSLQEKLQKRL
jgi:hypothetical protein